MSLKRFFDAVRRIGPRTYVRAGFLVVFLASCVQLFRFYQWALGNGDAVARSTGTAGLDPLGGLLSLIVWIKTGIFDTALPAAMVILIAGIILSVLFKRGFCGWICPIGTIMAALEWLQGHTIKHPIWHMNRKTDRRLHIPKYVAVTIIVIVAVALPASVMLEFQQLPFYAISDFSILQLLAHPGAPMLVLMMAVLILIVLVGVNVWCRYMCPLGALYSVLSKASPCTVARDVDRCIGCHACDRACPAHIKVSASSKPIRDVDCDGCQECVRACPKIAGAMSARIGTHRMPWQVWPVLIVGGWLIIWGIAIATGHWQTSLSNDVVGSYMRLLT